MKSQDIYNYDTSSVDKHRIQRIHLATALAIVAPCLTLIYGVWHYFILQSGVAALVSALFCISYTSYFIFMNKGLVKTARSAFMGVFILQLLILLPLSFSIQTGWHLYFLITGPIAFLIFEPDDYYHKTTIAVLSLLLFFTGVWLGDRALILPLIISPGGHRYLFFFNVVAVFTILLAIQHFYITQIKNNENWITALSKTDPLTGLSNRRDFFKIFGIQLMLSGRHKHELSLIMFDIDRFKRINDTWGFEVGDQVLAAISKAAGKTVRSTDTIARYGGEEFVVLLPQTSREQAFTVAEKLRTRIENLTIETTAGTDISCTVSIGVAGCTKGALDMETLIKQVDTAVYQAKKRGKNRTVIFE